MILQNWCMLTESSTDSENCDGSITPHTTRDLLGYGCAGESPKGVS
jgi:hypothetical protein